MNRMLYGTSVWVLALLPLISLGQNRALEVGVAGGVVHNFRTPLHIQQERYEDITLDARYRTEPFNPPVYYDIRVST